MRLTIHRRFIVFTSTYRLSIQRRSSLINILSNTRTLHSSRRHAPIHLYNRHVPRHNINLRVRHQRAIVRRRRLNISNRYTHGQRALLLPAKRIHATLHSTKFRSLQRQVSRLTNLHSVSHVVRPLVKNVSISMPRVINGHPQRRPHLLLCMKRTTPRVILHRLTRIRTVRNSFSPVNIVRPRYRRNSHQFTQTHTASSHHNLTHLTKRTSVSRHILLHIHRARYRVTRHRRLTIQRQATATRVRHHTQLQINSLQAIIRRRPRALTTFGHPQRNSSRRLHRRRVRRHRSHVLRSNNSITSLRISNTSTSSHRRVRSSSRYIRTRMQRTIRIHR